MKRKQYLDELADENVSLLVDGKQWNHWNGLEITWSMDTFSTCAFGSPFDPARSEFRQTFRPFTFKPLQVMLDDEPMFTGTMVGIEPTSDSESTSIAVTGYSLPAVINDCSPPVKTAPHSYDKMSLRTIASVLLAPFDVRVDFRGNDYQFQKPLSVKQGTKIFEFLSELAKQSGKLISNTPDGALLCWTPVKPGKPVAALDRSVNPFEIKATFNSQDYFSEITGFNPASRKKSGCQWTIQNPWLRNVLRPNSFDLDNIESGDVVAATTAKMGRMFANMASWTIEDLPTWRDPEGAIWEPNKTVQVFAPNAAIYSLSELIIRNVRFKKSKERHSCSLDLILPGSFSGELPKTLPWDEPITPFDMDQFIRQANPL